MKKKWVTALTAVLLCGLTVVGYLSVSADYGDQNDPLVSLSYITQVVLPQANTAIQTAFDTKQAEFNTKIDARVEECKEEIRQLLSEYNDPTDVDDALVNEVAARVSAMIQQNGSGTTVGSAPQWEVVRVTAGKTLTAQVGCQLLMRFGTAAVTAAAEPGLINLTTAAELKNGTALTANNLYMVTIKGNGVKVTADATFLVCGTYTVQ